MNNLQPAALVVFLHFHFPFRQCFSEGIIYKNEHFILFVCFTWLISVFAYFKCFKHRDRCKVFSSKPCENSACCVHRNDTYRDNVGPVSRQTCMLCPAQLVDSVKQILLSPVHYGHCFLQKAWDQTACHKVSFAQWNNETLSFRSMSTSDTRPDCCLFITT